MAADSKPSWYNSDITDDQVPANTRELLVSYSKIPPERVVPHILAVREQAFSYGQYPCIGQYRFLVLTLCDHPLYSSILERMNAHESFLDVGACFGQDLRKLVADGAPSENTFGLDIDEMLMEMGYELFLDKKTLQTKFLGGDVYDPPASWDSMFGQMDIIHISAFFHLFPRNKQLDAANLLVRFSRPKKGSIIVGRHLGTLTPGVYPAIEIGSEAYRHNLESLQVLWDEVGAATGTSWKVDGTMDTVGLEGLGQAKEKPHWFEPNMRRQLFTITRQ